MKKTKIAPTKRRLRHNQQRRMMLKKLHQRVIKRRKQYQISQLDAVLCEAS